MSVAIPSVAGVGFDPLRDKSYQSTRLGRDVADFLAWFELGGASPRTLDQYERDLARGALMFPDKAVGDLEDGDALHIARQFKPAERRVRVAAWWVRLVEDSDKQYIAYIENPEGEIVHDHQDSFSGWVPPLPAIEGRA